MALGMVKTCLELLVVLVVMFILAKNQNSCISECESQILVLVIITSPQWFRYNFDEQVCQ